MGNCYSKTQDNDARAGHPRPGQNLSYSKTSHVPSHILPPAYPIEHNISCYILRPWELDGEKSRSYRYTVYVNNNNLLNKRQQKAQSLILENIQLYAAIQGLTVWVKCLDYLSDEDSDADTEREKQFYKDMLAIDSKSALIRVWEDRPSNILPLPSAGGDKQFQQRRKTLKSSKQEIHDVIEKIKNNKGLDDADTKSQIKPQLIAALSRFNQGWKLEKFLVNKTQIFGKAPDIKAEGISKLQAQFFLQARAAYTSLDAPKGSVPTVAVHILPEGIPSSIFNNIRNYIATTCILLIKLARETGKTVRQDRYTMQLISLSTARGKHRHQ